MQSKVSRIASSEVGGTAGFEGLHPLLSVKFEKGTITVLSPTGGTLFLVKRSSWTRKAAFFREGADEPSFTMRPKHFVSSEVLVEEDFGARLGRIWPKRKGQTFEYALMDAVDYQIGVLQEVERKHSKEMYEELKRLTGAGGWWTLLKAMMKLAKTDPETARQLDKKYGDYCDLVSESGTLLRLLKLTFFKEVIAYVPEYARRVDERLVICLATDLLMRPSSASSD